MAAQMEQDGDLWPPQGLCGPDDRAPHPYGGALASPRLRYPRCGFLASGGAQKRARVPLLLTP
jgi:hypothetical protein